MGWYQTSALGSGHDWPRPGGCKKPKPTPMPNGQVHPTARSKISCHRIVKGFDPVLRPTVPSLEICRTFLGKHLLRELFSPAAKAHETNDLQPPHPRFDCGPHPLEISTVSPRFQQLAALPSLAYHQSSRPPPVGLRFAASHGKVDKIDSSGRASRTGSCDPVVKRAKRICSTLGAPGAHGKPDRTIHCKRSRGFCMPRKLLMGGQPPRELCSRKVFQSLALPRVPFHTEGPR